MSPEVKSSVKFSNYWMRRWEDNAPDLIIIVGLPASGKTAVATCIYDELVARKGMPNFGEPEREVILLDDAPSDLFACVSWGPPCPRVILTHPGLCMAPPDVWRLIHLGELWRWAGITRPSIFDIPNTSMIFFENDPEQCLINAQGRPDKDVDEYIKQLSKRYEVPEWADAYPVLKG